MTAMRAKVKITGIKPYPDAGEVSSEALSFSFPSKDGSYPADGSDEDQQFSKFTPDASLSMTISNPDLVGKFAVGDVFYLDFVPVETA